MCREAIRRDHVEPNARDECYAGVLCFLVAACDGFEDLDLARDVEIVGSRRETGRDHGLGSGGEGAGDMQHGREVFEQGPEPRPVVERENHEDKGHGVDSSDWVVITTNEALLKELRRDERAMPEAGPLSELQIGGASGRERG